jgi:NADH/NAD ratio-sensing transcriptional regulator Rex
MRRNKLKAASEQVSELTAGRLSVYLRCLKTLDAAGVKTISSKALAEQFQLNAAQIRKDLAYFGEFGVRGVGYYVKELRRHLRMILGLDRTVRVAILGAGNLGLALADYPGFRQEGFAIVALFDTERSKIGRRSKIGVRIYEIGEFRRAVKRRGGGARRVGSERGQHRGGRRGSRHSQFFAGHAEGAAASEAEERRFDGVTREFVFLHRQRRGAEWHLASVQRAVCHTSMPVAESAWSTWGQSPKPCARPSRAATFA